MEMKTVAVTGRQETPAIEPAYRCQWGVLLLLLLLSPQGETKHKCSWFYLAVMLGHDTKARGGFRNDLTVCDAVFLPSFTGQRTQKGTEARCEAFASAKLRLKKLPVALLYPRRRRHRPEGSRWIAGGAAVKRTRTILSASGFSNASRYSRNEMKKKRPATFDDSEVTGIYVEKAGGSMNRNSSFRPVWPRARMASQWTLIY